MERLLSYRSALNKPAELGLLFRAVLFWSVLLLDSYTAMPASPLLLAVLFSIVLLLLELCR